MMRVLLVVLVAQISLMTGCSSNDKPVIQTNAPTTTIEPVGVGGKGGEGAVGGLNKKIPRK